MRRGFAVIIDLLQEITTKSGHKNFRKASKMQLYGVALRIAMGRRRTISGDKPFGVLSNNAGKIATRRFPIVASLIFSCNIFTRLCIIIQC